MAKAKEEADRIIEEAKKLADEIVSKAERRREKLEAEKAFLEKAIKMKLKELLLRPEKEATHNTIM